MSAVAIVVGDRRYALPERGEVRWDHSGPVAYLNVGGAILVLTPTGGQALEIRPGVLPSESWSML